MYGVMCCRLESHEAVIMAAITKHRPATADKSREKYYVKISRAHLREMLWDYAHGWIGATSAPIRVHRSKRGFVRLEHARVCTTTTGKEGLHDFGFR